MTNLLFAAIESIDAFLKGNGFGEINQEVSDSSFTINLESSKYVGIICYWPRTNTFEFQFNICETGDVALLKTEEFTKKEDVETYLKQIIKEKLI